MFNLFNQNKTPALPLGFAPGVETILHGNAALIGADLPTPTQDESSDRLYPYELSLMLESLESGWEDFAFSRPKWTASPQQTGH